MTAATIKHSSWYLLMNRIKEAPDFLHESSQSGAFCIYVAILIYLQLFLSIFSISGGDRAATTEEDTEF